MTSPVPTLWTDADVQELLGVAERTLRKLVAHTQPEHDHPWYDVPGRRVWLTDYERILKWAQGVLEWRTNVGLRAASTRFGGGTSRKSKLGGPARTSRLRKKSNGKSSEHSGEAKTGNLARMRDYLDSKS